MKPTSLEDKIAKIAGLILAAILVLMPFHAILTTWAASNFGHLDLFKVWKDLILLPMVAYVLLILFQKKALRRRLFKSWLVRCGLIYVALYFGFGVVALQAKATNLNALLFSWVTNLQFMGFFAVAWIISAQNKLVLRYWAQILLGPAVVVVGFGLLQRAVLPADFLRHFGYGPNTIPAIETVDQKLNFRRIQSTLRGANPLGTYLIMVISACLVLLNKHRRWLLALLAGAVVVLFFSFSRGAWLGAVAAAAWLAWHHWHSAAMRRTMLTVAAVAVVLGGGLVWQQRHNDLIQNSLFHTDETSRASISSNAAHGNAIENGLRDVWHQPFGRGPGTAGPASVRNDHPPRIAENYYIQVAQEVGVIGVALFVAINLMLAKELYGRWRYPLARVLLISLVGVAAVNMLSHAWSDDTIAILWWSFAGAAMNLPLRRDTMNKQQT